ncbi:MAG: ABC transporter permease [Nitrospiraceae bacterium]|nr:ABC transporter permease [Nitrospiraceae bacterium]
MIQLRPIYVICMREFIKFFREKSRLLGTLARPVLWLFVVGNGMGSLIRPRAGFSYIQFIFPGMIGMTILFSSIFSSISIVWDREFGFMKEMLVAPISRLSIVIGKTLSGTLISVAQAVIILVFIPFLGIHLTIRQFFEVVAVSMLVSFCITSLGILIAARLTSFDGFNIIMNFLVMPMLFLSGAMYPVTSMPPALRHLTLINPLTYGIDALKHILLRNGTPPLGPEFPLLLDLFIVAVISVVMLTFAALSFRRKE